jgi:hypothetical protein
MYVPGIALKRARCSGQVDSFRYDDLAERAIRSILEAEHAAVWSEIEAKAADSRWPGLPRSIDPHHLTNARRILEDSGDLVPTIAITRGSRPIEVLHLAGTAKRRWTPAAARKRLLQARYHGWATGTLRHPKGLIGGAGEAVVHASLVHAAPAGYRLAERKGDDVRRLLGAPVPGGPLDNAAHLLLMKDDAPAGHVTVLIEVKNVRHWLYPTAIELFQLLDKAAQLQLAHPDRRFVPVIVCRRAQKLTFRMAKTLGFYVIDAHRQFMTPSADVHAVRLDEVRNELGYFDLITHDGALQYIVEHFEMHLPKVAERSASRWAMAAPLLADTFKALRRPVDQVTRSRLLDAVKEIVDHSLDDPGHWLSGY